MRIHFFWLYTNTFKKHKACTNEKFPPKKWSVTEEWKTVFLLKIKSGKRVLTITSKNLRQEEIILQKSALNNKK